MVWVMRIDVTKEATRFEPGSNPSLRNVMSVCTVVVNVLQNVFSFDLLGNYVSIARLGHPRSACGYVEGMRRVFARACSCVVLQEVRVWGVPVEGRVLLAYAVGGVDNVLAGEKKRFCLVPRSTLLAASAIPLVEYSGCLRCERTSFSIKRGLVVLRYTLLA